MKRQNKGFTLVELVIVAVILSILATIGFISYEDYLVDTRDSKRLAQLTGLRDGLRLGVTKGKLPIPDNAVEIRNDGITFLYQGYAGENVLEGISYSDATKDPFDNSYYTYMLSRNRKDFQLMGFLEKYNPDVISNMFSVSHAADYSQRFPQVMGKKLGIVLEQDTNAPLQEIPEYQSSGFMDLIDVTTNLFDAYITDTQTISGNESDLLGIIPFITCERIKQTNDSFGSAIYNVNLTGLDPFPVFCEMDIFDGGWTLVGRSVQTGLGGNIGWGIESGSVYDDSQSYSIGSNLYDLDFTEIMLATYDQEKNITHAIQIGVNGSILKNDQISVGSTFGCNNYPETISWGSPCDLDNQGAGKWGWFTDTNGIPRPLFSFRQASAAGSFTNSGLNKGGFVSYGGQDDLGFFDGRQGMIFVR